MRLPSLGMLLRLKVGDCVRVAALAVLLIMTAQTFDPYPGFSPLEEAWKLLCLLYLIFAYPWLRSPGRPRTTSFEWYVLLIIAIVPVWSGLCAKNEFGQPILYGMLAVRSVVLMAGVLFIVRSLRDRLFTVRQVETALLVVVWSLAFLYTFMRSFLNPNAYTSYVGFAMPGVDGAHFKLQPDFILFGVLYYALRGFRTSRISDYLLAIILLATVLDRYGGREMILALLLSFLVLVFRWTKARRLFIVIPEVALGLTAIVGTVYLVMPTATAARMQKFSDAFAVVGTGAPGGDASANTHFMEALYSLPAIAKHPILGNGRLSNQWGGGGDEVRGEHFYPEDVGLLGVLYQCGVFGLILFGWQYWFAARAAKNLPHAVANPLVDAVKGFLLYNLFVSFGGSTFVFEAALVLTFVAMLRFLADDERARRMGMVARSWEADGASSQRRRRLRFLLPSPSSAIRAQWIGDQR
jgi:hypothetical protein